ncbi:MAG: hypothetical protein GWN00_19515 [Aliifodinibius sp.]|nr:hypothetical protein [Fodinibius sp.]NIY26913.1 hypothetical protein [Fodinibius sp.]
MATFKHCLSISGLDKDLREDLQTEIRKYVKKGAEAPKYAINQRLKELDQAIDGVMGAIDSQYRRDVPAAPETETGLPKEVVIPKVSAKQHIEMLREKLKKTGTSGINYTEKVVIEETGAILERQIDAIQHLDNLNKEISDLKSVVDCMFT